MKAEAKALTVSRVQARSAKVAPVTTMDSPSAMMMKPAQRSAIWPPSTTQSATWDAPYFGIQNRTAGDKYSMPSAMAQSSSRACPSAKPPAFKSLRNRGREHQSAQHQQKQQDANRGEFGIEPVGGPGGVNPHPPHRQEQQGGLQHPQRGEPAQQGVRYLGDREDEHQIEK